MAEGPDTIGQVRVELAELRGMMTTVISDHGRRLTELEHSTIQLRTDLTAVNNNILEKISGLLSDGNKRGNDITNQLTANTSNIADMKADIVDIQAKNHSAGTRIATYITPVLSAVALITALYQTLHH